MDSIGSCFYCLTGDDKSTPAVTFYNGTAMCEECARARSKKGVQERVAKYEKEVAERRESLRKRRQQLEEEWGEG